MNLELVQGIHEILTRRGLTLASAESLTGGRVAAALTRLPGSSAFFMGGVVAYSNQLKAELLGVDMEILIKHGAVSEECALAMALGARRKLGTRVAVASTGIAGPDGATKDKPLGLVWLAAVSGHRKLTAKHIFKGDRAAVTEEAAHAALVLLHQLIGD